MAKKLILIVEDDEDIAEAVTDILTFSGCDVFVRENGLVALQFLAETRLPSLILLDLMMPVMDGFQFREKQLADPKLKDIPCVVMSADGHLLEKRCHIKVLDYLRKPLDLSHFLTTVRKYTDVDLAPAAPL